MLFFITSVHTVCIWNIKLLFSNQSSSVLYLVATHLQNAIRQNHVAMCLLHTSLDWMCSCLAVVCWMLIHRAACLPRSQCCIPTQLGQCKSSTSSCGYRVGWLFQYHGQQHRATLLWPPLDAWILFSCRMENLPLNTAHPGGFFNTCTRLCNPST